MTRKALSKEQMMSYLEKMASQRTLVQKQMQWNLDSLTLPPEVDHLFPNKCALFSQMRAFEQDMKSFIKAKIINVKEDLLAGGAKVKRTLRLRVTTTPNSSEQGWSLSVDGRIMSGSSQ